MSEREVIRALIRRKKLTQQEVADQIGVSRVTLNRYIMGETDLRSRHFMKLLQIVDARLEFPQ